MAIRDYRDKGSRDIAAGVLSKAARRLLPVLLHEAAQRRLTFLAASTSLDDLRAWPGLHLHALGRDRAGEYAIRINDKYRICFRWIAGNTHDIQITDYH